jgi:hypothetical protein
MIERDLSESLGRENVEWIHLDFLEAELLGSELQARDQESQEDVLTARERVWERKHWQERTSRNHWRSSPLLADMRANNNGVYLQMPFSLSLSFFAFSLSSTACWIGGVPYRRLYFIKYFIELFHILLLIYYSTFLFIKWQNFSPSKYFWFFLCSKLISLFPFQIWLFSRNNFFLNSYFLW